MQMRQFLAIAGACLIFAQSAYAQQAAVTLPDAAEAGGALPQITQPLLPHEKLKEEKKEETKPPAEKKKEILIPVKQFELLNIQVFPRLGITKEKVDILLNGLQKKFLEKHNNKGVTLVEIHTIANTLTAYYRSAGLILAQVYVPPQKINPAVGLVKLQLQVGRVGRVLPEGNKFISSKALIWPLRHLISQSLQSNDLESGMLTINSYPGYSGYSVLKKGDTPGTSDVIIKTEKNERASVTFGTDNNGASLTGRGHNFERLSINNIFGAPDQLTGMYTRNTRPGRGHYGAISYGRRIFDPNLEWGFSYSRNKYSLGREFDYLNFIGVSQTGDTFLKQTWIRQRETTASTKISMTRSQARSEYYRVPYRRDNLAVLGLQAEYGHLWQQWRGYSDVTFSYDHGFNNFLGAMKGHFPSDSKIPSSRQGGSGRFASGQFNKLSMEMSYLQRLFQNQDILFIVSGQYSHDLLVSLQQFSLGGVNMMRGFSVSEYSMDKGLYESLSWVFPIPFVGDKTAFLGNTWGRMIKFSFFVEQGDGWLNDPATTQKSFVSLTDYGAGLELALPGHLLMRTQWAKPFGFSRLDPADTKSSRVWFSLYYSLHLD
ncbi:MAG: ShlB/FhaC/HecB family hemolysin secretion/activation protein [Pseudomonadota bacterium]